MGTSKIMEKDPDAILDFGINYATWLGTDTLITSTWTAGAGITIASSSNTTTTATVRLSGGTAGKSYSVTNHIVTAGGLQDDNTLTILVQNK